MAFLHFFLMMAATLTPSCSAFLRVPVSHTTKPASLSGGYYYPRSVKALPPRRRHVHGVVERNDSAEHITDSLPNGTASSITTATTTQQLATLEEALEEAYSFKDAIYRTLGWVSAAIAFGGAIWTFAGPEAGEEFFAGYLVEQSLSVDNLFVFLLLFEYFKVPLNYQDRVLSWGIYGAIVMRGIMISLGATALENFHEVLLIFAAILVYSSAKFFIGDGDDGDDEEDPADNSIVQFARSVFPSTDDFDGDRFFTVQDGVRMATPLFICMVAVEISDVVFAVDSIPAVFGVTENPFIVFSSNLFAIMGLRSLYTILSQAATDLKYLEPAVALVLGFIGSKMIAEYAGFSIPTAIALGIVATLLGSGIALSVWERSREQQAEAAEVNE